MKPLIIPGLPLCTPTHRFVMISPRGKASEFSTWEELRIQVRKQLQSANLEMLHHRFFVFSREWLEVPMPEQWPLNIPPANEKRPEARRRNVVHVQSSSAQELVSASHRKSK